MKVLDKKVPVCAKLTDQDTGLRSRIIALANNPATPAPLLDYISTTNTVPAVESVAGNESASKITLLRLADHPSPRVRAAVTENRNAPFEILACLCEDEHPDVRFAMAENPRVPKSLLAKLINDDNPYVASRALTTLERLKGRVSMWLE